MPKAVYHAYGHVKKAAAVVNGRAGRLEGWKADLIARVADGVPATSTSPSRCTCGRPARARGHERQRGDANRCAQLVGGELGAKTPVHPNDDVNRGQSSNDTFPTAMHLATIDEITAHLLPAVRALQEAIEAKAVAWVDVVSGAPTWRTPSR